MHLLPEGPSSSSLDSRPANKPPSGTDSCDSKKQAFRPFLSPSKEVQPKPLSFGQKEDPLSDSLQGHQEWKKE